MSYTLKITVYNNRDYEQPFTLQDQDSLPLNLTGCTLSFGYGTETRTLGIHTTGTTANKCVNITDATNGAFELTLPYSILKTLNAGNYIHDLILTDVDGHRIGIWSGTLTVKRGVA